MGLHVNKAGLAEANDISLEWLRAPNGSPATGAGMSAPDPALKERSSKSEHAQSPSGSFRLGHRGERRRRAEALNETFTKEEIDFYEKNRGCAVHTTVNRIIRTLSTRMKNGGLNFAPPIISRIYQELSNGLLAYNQAIKMKEVAVPFVYVQYQALLLFFFTLVTPLGVGSFTSSQSQEWPSVVLAGFLSSFIVGSFTAMLVANELEDPFGMEPNDIDMMAFHHEFCALLSQLLYSPWMADDDWTADGMWKHQNAPPAEPKPSVLQAAGAASSGAPSSEPTSTTRTPSKWNVLRSTVGASSQLASGGGAEGGTESTLSVAVAAFASRGKHRSLTRRHRLRYGRERGAPVPRQDVQELSSYRVCPRPPGRDPLTPPRL